MSVYLDLAAITSAFFDASKLAGPASDLTLY